MLFVAVVVKNWTVGLSSLAIFFDSKSQGSVPHFGITIASIKSDRARNADLGFFPILAPSPLKREPTGRCLENKRYNSQTSSGALCSFALSREGRG